MRLHGALILTLALGFVAAACDHLGPFGGDPATVTLDSSVQYLCGRWIGGAAPAVKWGLFDVTFGRQGPWDPDDRPTEEHRRKILEASGTIVHEFNVPMIRAVLRPVTVPDLSHNFVRGVPDAARFPVELSITWRYTSGQPPDTAFVKSLGGVIVEHHAPMSTAVVPDSVLPAIRAHPDVRWVEGRTVFCLAND